MMHTSFIDISKHHGFRWSLVPQYYATQVFSILFIKEYVLHPNSSSSYQTQVSI